MSTRTPALLLALLAACTRDAPPPEAPVTTAPVVTADYTPPPPSEPTPTQPTTTQPTPSEPTPITHAPIASGPPGPITGAPPLRTPPPAPDVPAAIAIAVASVQISQDCPDEPNPAPPARPIASDASMHVSDMAESKSRSYSPRIGPPTCDQSTLQLSLTNTGGRTSTLQLEQVRILDGTGKRVLGTLPSRKPTFWSADTYQPWNQQVPGNLTAQVAYRLGEPVWQGGNVVALELQPYFVEVIVKVDGRKRTIRSAEFIPRTFDLVET